MLFDSSGRTVFRCHGEVKIYDFLIPANGKQTDGKLKAAGLCLLFL
jgi:hypothetical protein